MLKKKIMAVTAAIAVGAVTLVNVVTVIQQQKDAQNWESLMLSDVESVARGENNPVYNGSKNQYCLEPAGVTGCASSTNPNHVCTLGIFCIKP